MQHYGQRAVARCHHLAGPDFSEHEGELFRYWLGPAYRRAIEQVQCWMAEAGMATRLDAAGSVIGRYEGIQPDAPALVIGSHLDTVRNGGAFDGILGVMLGIETVAALHDAGRRYPFAIEVVGFGDEEGSRFPIPMIASRAMAGVLGAVPEGITDMHGRSVAEAMTQFGLPPEKLHEAARSREDTLAFIEAHIEQGPCIEAADGALGVVTAIASQLRQRIVVEGKASHAGTTPMGLRQDALAGAAEMVILVEKVALAQDSEAVATVGQVVVEPNVSNVIAQKAWFSLDIRAGSNEECEQLMQSIHQHCQDCATRRNLTLSYEATHRLASSACASTLMDHMAEAVEAVTGRPAQYLLSGAGHDTMALSRLCPTAMLFIRNPAGLSHHPDETVRSCDVEAAHQALMTFLEVFVRV